MIETMVRDSKIVRVVVSVFDWYRKFILLSSRCDLYARFTA